MNQDSFGSKIFPFKYFKSIFKSLYLKKKNIRISLNEKKMVSRTNKIFLKTLSYCDLIGNTFSSTLKFRVQYQH